jgi:protein TonB
MHLILLGVMSRITCELRHPTPIMVDLTFNSTPSVELPSREKSGSPAVTQRRPAPPQSFKQTAVSQTAPPPLPAAHEQTTAAPSETAFTPIRDQKSVVAISTTQTSSSSPVASPVLQAAKVPDGSVTFENARQRYLKEHFTYLRNLISKQLVYPSLARKMGWSGKVTVAFVIIEDGSVQTIRVVESSGFPLLDKSAVETVRVAAPFPKPPVRAEIIVPVNFKLMP